MQLALDGMTAVAAWMLKQEQTEVAAQLLAFIQGHKATTQETRGRVNTLLAEVGDQSLERDAEIEIWQKDEPIEEVVQKLLAEFFPP